MPRTPGPRASPPPDRRASLGAWLPPWAPALLVFGLALASYWPALHGAQLWDDSAHIVRPDLRSVHGLARIWTEIHATQQYYPVLYSAFWLEHRVWGDSTFGYHLLNVLLHAGSSCLVALLLRRLWNDGVRPSTGSTSSPPASLRGSDPGRAGARDERRWHAGVEWLAAALLAVHPVGVESVAWISEQKNTLSLFFALAAALAFLEFAARRRSRWYLAATGLFLLALGSKTMTATLPAALLVAQWWQRGTLSWRRDVVPLVPWFLLAIGSGVVTAWVEREYVGAHGGSFSFTAGQRVLLAARIAWFYLGHAVWPGGLNFFYERWNVAQDASSWIVWLGLGLAVTAALWAIRGRSRGPLAAWLLFVGPLFPALGFFNVYPFVFSFVADHFQYAAMPALAAAAAAGAGLLLARLPAGARIAGRVAVGAAVLALAIESHQLAGRYVDNETLFRATVARNPRAWMAWQILGTTFAKAPGRGAEAVACYQEVLAINPDYPDAQMGLAAELARLPGRRAEAITHYERAVQLRPNYVEARNNLGVELAQVPGRLPDAIAQFEAALRLAPGFAQAHANLADALLQVPGRLPEAVQHCEAAVALRPDWAEAHYHLAMLLARMPDRAADAIAQAEAALRLRPDYLDALNALAIIHAQQGRLDRARAYWEQALRIDPSFAPARSNLQLLRQTPR